MQNLMIASCLVVAASAYDYSGPGLAVWPTSVGYGGYSTVYGAHGYRIGKRSAEPFYGLGGTSGYQVSQSHPGLSGSHQQVSRAYTGLGYGYGKRSAEAYGYGISTLENRNNIHGHELNSQYAIIQPHPGHAGSFQAVSKNHLGYGRIGYGYGKRSAEAYGYGISTLENRNNIHGHELNSQYAISQPHPGHAGSFQAVTKDHLGYGRIGHGYGKRSAEAYGYGISTLENRNNIHGHELNSQYAISQPHPGHAGSFQAVSKDHLGYGRIGYGYGKRSAYYGSGIALHPGRASSFTARSPQGIHGYGYDKRSAKPFYGYGIASTVENQNNVHGHELGSGYAISQPHPGHSGSFQQVERLHSGIVQGYLG